MGVDSLIALVTYAAGVAVLFLVGRIDSRPSARCRRWCSRPSFPLGFVVTFTAGGLTGVMVAVRSC